MTSEEAENRMLALLQIRVAMLGVGVAFMEPYVFMSKIRQQRPARGEELYLWQETPLLLVKREKIPGGLDWTVCEPGTGAIIERFTQTY